MVNSEDLGVPRAPVPPLRDYLSQIDFYLGLFCKTPLSRVYRQMVLKAWLWWSDFVPFHEKMASGQIDTESFYRERDGHATFRESLLTLNFSVLLDDEPIRSSAIDRASRLVVAALELHERLQAGTYQIDSLAGQAQDMSEFFNIFGTSLIPGAVADRITHAPPGKAHFVVLCRGRFFEVPIPTNVSCRSLGPVFKGEFERIALDAGRSQEGSTTQVALLSACDRDFGYSARSRMADDWQNEASFESLKNALFIVALDLDLEPNQFAEAARLVHSGNTSNRWYDAGLQIVVFGNSSSGLVFSQRNHIDGNVGARFASDLHRLAQSSIQNFVQDIEFPQATSPSPGAPTLSTELRFRCPRETLETARERICLVTRNEQDSFRVSGTGSSFFKRHGMSPDVAFMIALHHASARFFKRPLKIFQIFSMGHFRHVGIGVTCVSFKALERVLKQIEGTPSAEHRRNLGVIEREHKAWISKLREGMPLHHVFHCYLTRSSKVQRTLFQGLLRLIGFESFRADVITSHPKEFPGIAAFGRPGVVLPYLKYYGLHYEIHPERIELIFMPGIKWRRKSHDEISTFAAEIGRSLSLVAKILTSTEAERVPWDAIKSGDGMNP